jgi:hypothetical protein
MQKATTGMQDADSVLSDACFCGKALLTAQNNRHKSIARLLKEELLF